MISDYDRHELVRQAALLTRCPDCHADRELDEVSPGVIFARILHDASCPTYRRLKAAGVAE